MAAIDVPLVEWLIGEQFPEWGSLPVSPVAEGGWDNRTFRLGREMLVRLPSAEHYVAQVAKEHAWLPRLAPCLPLPAPVPLALGRPGAGYPWPWSVYGWLDGETAKARPVDDRHRLASDLAGFLVALHAADAHGGPPAGRHNFERGGRLSVYDGETREAIAAIGSEIDAAKATRIWDAALASIREGPPLWVHGDIAEGNLLVCDGRLCAVIDFGCLGVGDPACDLAAAWTMFCADSRKTFRRSLMFDAATWARARGWGLWKALITHAQFRHSDAERLLWARSVIAAVMADH